jgi:L-rhamnose mutarotase
MSRAGAVAERSPIKKGGATKMECVGLRTRLKLGMEDAYEKAHAVVWPELVTAQRELGISRWLIFRDGLELFHTVECENFKQAVAGLAQHPVDRSWQAHMGRYVVVADDRAGAATDRLRLVYAG